MAKKNTAKKNPVKKATPVVVDEEPTEKKTVKVSHPGIGKEGIYPFKETPEDFSFEEHLSLKKSDFANNSAYFNHRALEMDSKAEAFRDRAKKEAAKGGRKGSKLAKMITQIQKLKATLAAQGVDTAAIEAEALAALEEGETK